jgi:hypothetical protein
MKQWLQLMALALAVAPLMAQDGKKTADGAKPEARAEVQKPAPPAAQEPVLSASTKQSASPLMPGRAYAAAMADNSFFIEEAFNQEPGVVQHIFSFSYARGGDFFYNFTQEWPVPGQRHQLSLSLPYASLSGAPRQHGIGDILLNYRFGGVQREHFAVAPRVSLVIPSGNNDRGLGSGSAGVQFNLPLSHRFSESWIYHLNAGSTLLPRGRVLTAGGPARRHLHSYNLGGSMIWLAKPNFNAMLESFANFNHELDPSGARVRSTDVFVSPGLRWAINVGDLQIVPGVGVPFRVNGGAAPRGVLLYLSFEHPFGARPPKR